MEAKQRVLECTFRNIKQLRSELSYITKEAESRQDHIQGFLSAFIPEFKNYRNSEVSTNTSRKGSLLPVGEEKTKSHSENTNSSTVQERNTPSSNKTREKSLQETKKEVENNFADRLLPTPSCTPPAAGDFVNHFPKNLSVANKFDEGKCLPLPKIEYNWKERESSQNKMPTYLPRLGNIRGIKLSWYQLLVKFLYFRSFKSHYKYV